MKAQSYSSAEDFLDDPSGRCCDCLIPENGLPGMSGRELQSRLAASHGRFPISRLRAAALASPSHGPLSTSIFITLRTLRRGSRADLWPPFKRTSPSKAFAIR